MQDPDVPHTPDSPPVAGRSTDPTWDPPGDLAAIPSFLRDRDRDRDRTDAQGVARSYRGRGVRAEPASETIPVTAAAVAALPMAGLPPRRLAVLGIAIVLTWMVVSFGRQVAEASAVTTRADQLRASTAALAIEVAGLEKELQTVQDPRYIEGAARAYRLGTSREIAFALEVGAPQLGPDAPGSASVRLGAELTQPTPLERWLDILFGPAR